MMKEYDPKRAQDKLREFMYMRMAKGKKHEVFDLLHRSEWNYKYLLKEDQEGGYNQNGEFSYKHSKTSMQITLSKINLLLFMGALTGMIYVQLHIVKVDMIKEMFLLEIEKQKEVYISDEIS